ncbi:Variant-specific surface protein, partial [Giardia duodenalis]
VNDPAGVSIDSFCRPASSPQATAAGCTGKDGAALTNASTACGMCSGGFFLFRGGCYKVGEAPGSEICTKAEGGKCTACNAANGLFQNPAASPTLGSECILCWDTTGANQITGVAGCSQCTKADSNTGTATCSACQAGYVKATNANECKPCGTGCSACSASDQSQCTACLEGKYLDGTSCVDASSCTGAKYPDPKTNKCIQCNAAAEQGGIPECTACTYSDSLQKPVCNACNSAEQNKLLKKNTDGTTTCVNAAGCATNNQAGTHFLSTDSQKCILCNDKSDTSNQGIEGCGMCKKAAPDQSLTCTACTDGYYDSASGGTATCVACTGTNCATCSKATKDQCSTCKPGYFKQGDSPGTCTPCDDADSGIPGCAECTFSGSLACISCKPNYKKSGSSPVTCTKTCEDETACGGTAGACNAIVVDGDGNMKYYCSYCGKAGEAPINGICTTTKNGNDSGCTSHTCTSCTTGYFLYMGDCYSTTSAPGSLMCKAATNGICTAAANSRYFAVPGAKVTDQSVLACGNPLGTTTGTGDTAKAYVGVEGCKTCTAPSAPSPAGMTAAKCTACDEGKVLTGSGYGCVMCSIAGCSTCRADNMCEACGDGHRLEGGTCVRTGGNLSTGRSQVYQ